jgi:hypothetical protein
MWRKVANRIRRQRIDPYRNDGGTAIANVRRNGMKTGDRQPMRSALQLWLSRDKLFPQDTFCTLSLCSAPEKAGVDAQEGLPPGNEPIRIGRQRAPAAR